MKYWATAVFLGPLLGLTSACAEPVEEEVGYEVDVVVDINPDVDLSSYSSFDVVVPSSRVEDPAPYEFAEVEGLVVDAVVAELTARGLTRDTAAPELLVNPVVNVNTVTSILHFYDSYYGWYWGYDYLWTIGYEFARGTLIVDVVDQGAIEDIEDDLLVYRGIARGMMAEDLEVIELEIRNAMLEIFAEWPEI